MSNEETQPARGEREPERLARECAKLDSREEQALAEEWLTAEVDWVED